MPTPKLKAAPKMEIARKAPTRHRSAENVDLAIDMAAIAENAIRLSKTTTIQTAPQTMRVIRPLLSLLLKPRRPSHVPTLTVQQPAKQLKLPR